MSAAEQLRDWILTQPMSYTTERELQDAIWARVQADRTGLISSADREYRLDEGNRIDFLVDVATETSRHRDGRTSVGIEVKVGSALAEVVRQLQRYAAFALVDELLLVTTKAHHHHVPSFIGGKRVVLCSLVEVGL